MSSRSLGASWVLNEVWKGLKLDRVLVQMLKPRHYRADVERAIFAMVANRALAPSSKLAIEEWVAKDTFIPGLGELAVQHMYRAMDFLLEAKEDVEREVFFQTANLLNLEVDLLYFDTTSTYFEVEGVAEEDIRQKGHGKDSRPDLSQVVIGLAVTREGIPVRMWVRDPPKVGAGNTPDMNVIPEVKRDLAGWKLGRVITVVDRGFCSESNLRELQRAGGHYIAGEKIRRAGRTALKRRSLERDVLDRKGQRGSQGDHRWRRR